MGSRVANKSLSMALASARALFGPARDAGIMGAASEEVELSDDHASSSESGASVDETSPGFWRQSGATRAGGERLGPLRGVRGKVAAQRFAQP